MGKLSIAARLLVLFVVVALGSASKSADAQIPGLSPPTPADATNAEAATPEAEAPQPLSTASIPQNARGLDADLATIRETLRPQASIEEAGENIQTDAADLDRLSRLAEPESLGGMNRIALEDLEREIETQRAALLSMEGLIEARLGVLQESSQKLEVAGELWSITQEALSEDLDAPEAVITRTDEVIAAIDEVKELLADRITAVVEVDDLREEVSTAADLAIRRVHRAQTDHRGRLLRRSGPPIWRVFSAEHLAEGEVPPPWPKSRINSDTFERVDALYGGRLPLDLIFFGLFTLFVLVLSRRARATDSMADPILTSILGHPLASALLVALMVFRFVYFRAPSSAFGVMALLATPPLFILTPVLARRDTMRRPLMTLLVFCTVEMLTQVFPVRAPWSRLINLTITASFLLVLARFLHSGALKSVGGTDRVMRMAPPIAHFSGALLSISLLGELAGFTTLSSLLTAGVLMVGFVSLLVLAFVRVLDALVESALTSRRSVHIRAIRRHGRLIQQNTSSVVHFVGWLILAYFSLRAFDLYDPLIDSFVELFETERSLGSFGFTFGGLFGFVLVIYITRKLAKLVAFFLNEELLPRLELERGVPETITRLTKYLIFMFGFLLAVGVAGVDMSSVALLASALSVGIGFGLQNIVNNFVSGLILTFEQPVRVGDTVEVGNMVGKVKSIGARSSTVRTFQGSEVIVPNADLISNQVINWTRSDQNRRVEIQVGVAYGTRPDRVLGILRKTALESREVMIDPGPVTLFTGFGDSSLDFELRVWVNTKHDWVIVASELRERIYRRLEAAEIEIPFPQRDLHLRSVDEKAAGALNTEITREEAPI